LTFAATYRSARAADAKAAVGSDLRLTPADPTSKLPPLGPEVAATSAFRLVPARVGSDRKTVLTIDLDSYRSVSTVAPRIVRGAGPEALARDPRGVLVATEIANLFGVGPGDTLPLTVYPDDFENSTSLRMHVIGVYRSFPPTSPPPDMPAELVMSTGAFPRSRVTPPDFYLARIAPGRSPEAVAADLRNGAVAQQFTVTTVGGQNQRGLTALNLDGLGRIESTGGALVAAIGVAVLAVFLVLERRREFAILRATGANTKQVLTGPAQEGTIAVFGSLVIGVPLGIGLGMLAVRILGLFFTLPPPLVRVPFGSIGIMVSLTVATSAVALAVALRAVTRTSVAGVLRGQ
jgi:putative ABC transport system permease protein